MTQRTGRAPLPTHSKKWRINRFFFQHSLSLASILVQPVLTRCVSGDPTAGKRSVLLFRASPPGMDTGTGMHKPSEASQGLTGSRFLHASVFISSGFQRSTVIGTK